MTKLWTLLYLSKFLINIVNLQIKKIQECSKDIVWEIFFEESKEGAADTGRLKIFKQNKI